MSRAEFFYKQNKGRKVKVLAKIRKGEIGEIVGFATTVIGDRIDINFGKFNGLYRLSDLQLI